MNLERQTIEQPLERARATVEQRRSAKLALAIAQRVFANDLFDVSAALAYRWLLALFPFLMAVGSLGGVVARLFRIGNPTQQLLDLAGSSLPPALAAIVRDNLGSVLDDMGGGGLTLALGIAIVVAAGGTLGVMRATNRAYAVKESRTIASRYALALGLTVLAGAAIFAAFALLVVVQFFAETIATSLGGSQGATVAVVGLRWLLAFAALVGASAVLYRYAPSRELRWRSVLPGALVFSVAWLVATWAFAFYASSIGGGGPTFGAFGGAIVLLVWLYLTALVLLIGAECNALLSDEAQRAA